LAVFYIKAGEENNLQSSSYSRIIVHNVGDGIDQFNNKIGRKISGRRLAPEDKGARGDVYPRVFPDPVIERDYVKDIKMLALMFLKAFHMYVEKAIGINRNSGPVINDSR
jgi:hypothetical protein